LHPDFPKVLDKSAASVSDDTGIIRQKDSDDGSRPIRLDNSFRREQNPQFDKLAKKYEHRAILLSILSLQDRTARTKWIGREIDKITSLGYFKIVVFTFISAEFLLPSFLDKFLVNFQGIPQARIIIVIFSLISLIAVSAMLYWRLKELQSKALTTFKFLVELDAIKIDKEDFDKSLQEIEKYLTNGDWTLAEFWVTRVMRRYDDIVKKNLDK
jgi:hypothetical protein